MTKDEIIAEIRRIAEMDGKPPGRQKFENMTGIAQSKWYGIHWARWGDALSEAGYPPNEKQGPTDIDLIIKAYLSLVESLGHVPTSGEIRLKSKNSTDFPAHTTFSNRLGNKSRLLQVVTKYAKENHYPLNTVSMLENAYIPENPLADTDNTPERPTGFVYLMKSGKHYKIGHTNSLDRRQYEIGLQLPEKIEPIHSIETDDPSGIEAYWHNRFKDKRLNGEWFTLSLSDVRIFKKRKFM